MAVVKACRGGGTIGKGLDYIDKKAELELKSGINCSDEKHIARQQMQQTKEDFNKEGGREFKHFVQSFAPGETDPRTAHEIGKEFAEKNWGDKGYEVYVATHTDKGHIHNHFVINSVNRETGLKYDEPKNALERLKNVSDEICKGKGLSIIDRTKNRALDGEIRTYSNDKYRVLEKAFEGTAKSYIFETAKAVRDAQDNAQNKSEFIQNMKEKGYKVDWQEQRKNITFTDQDGKKVRLSNLEKTFNSEKFSKDMMIKSFEHNRTLKTIENIDLSKEKIFGTELKQEVTKEVQHEQNLNRLRDFNKNINKTQKIR